MSCVITILISQRRVDVRARPGLGKLRFWMFWLCAKLGAKSLERFTSTAKSKRRPPGIALWATASSKTSTSGQPLYRRLWSSALLCVCPPVWIRRHASHLCAKSYLCWSSPIWLTSMWDTEIRRVGLLVSNVSA